MEEAAHEGATARVSVSAAAADGACENDAIHAEDDDETGEGDHVYDDDDDDDDDDDEGGYDDDDQEEDTHEVEFVEANAAPDASMHAVLTPQTQLTRIYVQMDPVLRKRGIELVLLEKWKVKHAARAMGVGRSALSRAISQFRLNPTHERPERRSRSSLVVLTEDQKARIRNWVDADCALSFTELGEKARAAFGFAVPVQLMNYALHNVHFSFDRTLPLPTPRERWNSSEALLQRYTYAMEYIRLFSKRSKFVFVDEVEFSYSMRIRASASRGGERCRIHSQLFSVAVAIMENRFVMYKVRHGEFVGINFPILLARAADALQEAAIDDAVVFMGSAYKPQYLENREAVMTFGHSLRFLPPHSPFLSPTEAFFAQWKQLVRRGPPPATERDLHRLIETCGARVLSEECSGFFQRTEAYLHPSILTESIQE